MVNRKRSICIVEFAQTDNAFGTGQERLRVRPHGSTVVSEVMEGGCFPGMRPMFKTREIGVGRG